MRAASEVQTHYGLSTSTPAMRNLTTMARTRRPMLILVVLWCAFAIAASAQGQHHSPFQLPHWSADSLVLSAPSAQTSVPAAPPAHSPCIGTSLTQLKSDTLHFGRSLPSVPRNMVQSENLKWEIPVGITAAVLAQWVDVRASNRIHSEPFTTANDDASNALIGAEMGATALTYIAGCASGDERTRSAGFATLEAGAYGLLSDLALKAAFNREYPNKTGGEGRFWHGGKSFPSAHAATGWAMAAAVAHQYPQKRWVKWAAYSAAASITALRFTARKHFPSDLVIGGAIGYVIGRGVGTEQ